MHSLFVMPALPQLKFTGHVRNKLRLYTNKTARSTHNETPQSGVDLSIVM